MKKLVSALLAFSMLFFYVPTLGAAGPGNILHEKLTCAPENAQPKLYAKVVPLTSFTSFQALFYSNAFTDAYFVEMVRGPDDRFFTFLPWRNPKITKGFTYQIVMKNAGGTVFSTEKAIVPFSSDCPFSPLSKQEMEVAANLIVGHTTERQPYAPPEGWYCKDIKYEITAKDEKRLAEGCRKLLALLPAGEAGEAGAAGAVGAGAVGAGTAGAAAGISTGVLLAAGAGAIVAGGLIISNNSGGGGRPVVSSALPGGAQAQPPK